MVGDGFKGASDDGYVGGVLRRKSVRAAGESEQGFHRIILQARLLRAAGGAEFVCCFYVSPIARKPLAARL